MKVYVITCGEYSDYRICAVTLDEKKAEELKKRCDHFDYTGASIEEYDTDYCESIITDDVYRVCFDEKGDVNTIAKSVMSSYTLELCRDKPTYNPNTNLLVFCVMAPHAEAAIKIAAERRAKYLAEINGL